MCWAQFPLWRSWIFLWVYPAKVIPLVSQARIQDTYLNFLYFQYAAMLFPCMVIYFPSHYIFLLSTNDVIATFWSWYYVQRSCPTEQLGEFTRIIFKSTHQKVQDLGESMQQKADGTMVGLTYRQMWKENRLQITLFYSSTN